MSRPVTILTLLCCVVLCAQGCTNRAWYEGFKQQQRRQCYSQTSQGEIGKCLDRVNGMTYDQYRRARGDLNK